MSICDFHPITHGVNRLSLREILMEAYDSREIVDEYCRQIEAQALPSDPALIQLLRDVHTCLSFDKYYHNRLLGRVTEMIEHLTPPPTLGDFRAKPGTKLDSDLGPIMVLSMSYCSRDNVPVVHLNSGRTSFEHHTLEVTPQ